VTNLDKWIEIYRGKLVEAVAENPEQYVYPVTEVSRVVARMRDSFERGSYNKEGRAIKATCKHFGIKHTYTAINQFLRQ
jgi:hypothetical protein